MKKNLVTITAFIASLFLTTLALAQDPLLEGAWQATEFIFTGGSEEDTTNTEPPLQILVQSAGYYSVMRNVGDRPDPVPEGQTRTDEDRLAAFAAFHAQTGMYEVSGSKIMYHAMLDRIPEYVGDTVEVEYQIEGDKLIWTIGPNRERSGVLRLTFTRLD